MQRRSRALAGALALIALGVAGSLGYWVAMSLPAPSEAPLPLATATSGGRESALPPATFEPPRAAGPGPVGPDVSPVASPQAGLRLEADQRARASLISRSRARPQPHTAQPDQHLVGGLPVNAPTHVTVNFPGDDPDAEQLAATLAQHLRGRGLTVGDPSSIPQRPSEPSITYFFDEDHEGAVAVERILGGLLGKSRLTTRLEAGALPRPGSVVVVVPAH